MSKKEFLRDLREALEGEIPEEEIVNQLEYYKEYISGQDSEKDALEELGNPRLIAKTVIDSYTTSKGPMASYYTEQARSEYSEAKRAKEEKKAGMHATEDGKNLKWYEKLIWGLVTLAGISLLFGVFVFLLGIAVQIAVPVVLIFAVYIIFKNLFFKS